MVSNRVVLHFPRDISNQPIIYRLVKEYDLMFNILQARIDPDEEGLLILELSGSRENYAEGIKYLQSQGVGFQLLSQDIFRNEDRCTHCGACTVMCPTEALSMNREEMTVEFDSTKCIACMLCMRMCPQRAIEVTL
ncbi:4Fe-4S binding protein [bacterium]|nr:4Fe-4S binding protein [bacterium]